MKKRKIDEIGKNNVNIVSEPIHAPKKILFMETFRFKVLLTVSKRLKSKNKFKRNTKSR